MWFKNLFIFRLTKWDHTIESIEEHLSQQSLQPCGGSDMQTRGWVSPKGEGQPLVHKAGDQLLISLGFEKKLLPSSVINQFAKAKAAEIEEREGYKPGRKQMKEIKEMVTDELLPRAFAIQSRINAWIDTKGKWLVVDASSSSKVDDLVGLLMKSLPNVAMIPLKTKTMPGVAMTAWLAENDSPPQFTVDQDCELKSRGEHAATVRYVKHSLEIEEIAKHTKSGKDVTKLAMTWADKVSFVLQDNMQIKRIAPLDILKEQAAMDADGDAFDTDFVLMTGELRLLIEAMIDTLGGVFEHEKMAA